MKLYCVYDRVAAIFAAPFPSSNHASACRAFLQVCSDKQEFADLDLYHVGEFDDETGKILPVVPEFIYRGGQDDEKEE